MNNKYNICVIPKLFTHNFKRLKKTITLLLNGSLRECA